MQLSQSYRLGYFKVNFLRCVLVVCLQQALENSGLSVVQPKTEAASAVSQNQNSEVSAPESKKVEFPDKSIREKKRSIFKKPIQMPGRLGQGTFISR